MSDTQTSRLVAATESDIEAIVRHEQCRMEREFWQHAFCAAMQSFAPEVDDAAEREESARELTVSLAAHYADAALATWRKRWEHASRAECL
jgi:cation transport regulator ChaB